MADSGGGGAIGGDPATTKRDEKQVADASENGGTFFDPTKPSKSRISDNKANAQLAALRQQQDKAANVVEGVPHKRGRHESDSSSSVPPSRLATGSTISNPQPGRQNTATTLAGLARSHESKATSSRRKSVTDTESSDAVLKPRPVEAVASQPIPPTQAGEGVNSNSKAGPPHSSPPKPRAFVDETESDLSQEDLQGDGKARTPGRKSSPTKVPGQNSTEPERVKPTKRNTMTVRRERKGPKPNPNGGLSPIESRRPSEIDLRESSSNRASPINLDVIGWSHTKTQNRDDGSDQGSEQRNTQRLSQLSSLPPELYMRGSATASTASNSGSSDTRENKMRLREAKLKQMQEQAKRWIINSLAEINFGLSAIFRVQKHEVGSTVATFIGYLFLKSLFAIPRMTADGKVVMENLLFVNENFTVMYDRIMGSVEESLDSEAKEAVRKFHDTLSKYSKDIQNILDKSFLKKLVYGDLLREDIDDGAFMIRLGLNAVTQKFELGVMDLFASLLKMTTNAKDSMGELKRILETFYERLLPNLYEEAQRIGYVDGGAQTGDEMSEEYFKSMIAKLEQNKEVAAAFNVLETTRQEYLDEETRRLHEEGVQKMTKKDVEAIADLQSFFEKLIRAAQYELSVIEPGQQPFMSGLDSGDYADLNRNLELVRRISTKRQKRLEQASNKRNSPRKEWGENNELLSLEYTKNFLEKTASTLRKRDSEPQWKKAERLAKISPRSLPRFLSIAENYCTRLELKAFLSRRLHKKCPELNRAVWNVEADVEVGDVGFFEFDSGTFIKLMNACENDFQITNLTASTQQKKFTFNEQRQLTSKQQEQLSKRFVSSNKEKPHNLGHTNGSASAVLMVGQQKDNMKISYLKLPGTRSQDTAKVLLTWVQDNRAAIKQQYQERNKGKYESLKETDIEIVSVVLSARRYALAAIAEPLNRDIEFREYPEFRVGGAWGYFSESLKGKSHLYKVSTFREAQSAKEGKEQRKGDKGRRMLASFGSRMSELRKDKNAKETSTTSGDARSKNQKRRKPKPEDREPRPILLGLVGDRKYEG